MVQDRRVGNVPWRHIQSACANPVEERCGVASLDQELSKAGLIENRDSFPSGPVFTGDAVEPMRLSKAEISRDATRFRLEPAGSFPSAPITEFGAKRGKALVER